MAEDRPALVMGERITRLRTLACPGPRLLLTRDSLLVR